MNAIFLLGMCEKANLLLLFVLLLSNTQTSFIPPMWHYGMVNIPQPQQTYTAQNEQNRTVGKCQTLFRLACDLSGS